MSYRKGDILWVEIENRNAEMLKHPAVLWEQSYNGDGDFLGIMITHTPPSQRFENILMKENHFESGQEIDFNNSHFVNQLFIKFEKWNPFHFAGRLTNEGIQFIEDNLTNNQITDFETYRKR